MNTGTIIRTIARFAVSAYTAFCVWQTVVDGFGNKKVSLIWAILIIAFGWIVDFATTWYNNDYTPEACIGTGITRQRKEEKKNGYIGEIFYDEEFLDDNVEHLDEEGEEDEQDAL